jgi:multimeric flavodoxin WrbA
MDEAPEAVAAVALNCTLKPAGEASSTDRMLDLIVDELAQHGVTTTSFRVVDEDVRFGVRSDEGGGDGWPRLLEQIMVARILVLGTPIWLGHPASPCQVVMERLDALISEEADDGRPVLWDKVGVLAVVGNEDGAHHVTAEVFQGLNDCGFTIPAGGAVYWVGEAMGAVDFVELDEVPEGVRTTAARLASNAVHLAGVLRRSPYPPAG